MQHPGYGPWDQSAGPEAIYPGFTPWDPTAGVPGRPYPYFGAPAVPHYLPFPWQNGEDGNGQFGGNTQDRKPDAAISQAPAGSSAKPVKAPSKRKSKGKADSTRAAISRYIERSRRRSGSSQKKSKSSPWLG
ncbi:hypothetical protein LJK87_25180 [Paenibacillus sp. P25]|nr:hypothetical protein LJK87_25180 [Paenibacillus sp. P25]